MVFDIGSVLASWQAIGVFDFLLPFLLIFAIMFGILTSIRLFGENRGVNTIISFVVALLALQWPLVPEFFREVFPRLGVGITVVLIILVLIGMFVSDQDQRVAARSLMGVGGVIALIIIAQAFSSLPGLGGYGGVLGFLGISIAEGIIWAAVIIALIVIIATPRREQDNATFAKKLFGGGDR